MKLTLLSLSTVLAFQMTSSPAFAYGVDETIIEPSYLYSPEVSVWAGYSPSEYESDSRQPASINPSVGTEALSSGSSVDSARKAIETEYLTVLPEVPQSQTESQRWFIIKTLREIEEQGLSDE